MATEAQILTASAGDLPSIDFGQQLTELQAAVPQEKDPKRRAVLEKDLAHVQGVNDLLAMKPEGAGTPKMNAATGGSHVDELLALPKIADTSDPKGNMDARDIRQTQDYAEQLPPSWMARARQAMQGVPSARAALELAQPGVGNAVARRAVSTIAGAPGDMIDFAGNVIPQLVGAKGLHGKTGLPTTEDVSGALDRAGWKDTSAEHPIASQFGSALGAVTPMGPLTDAALIRPLIGRFSKARELGQAAEQGVTGAVEAGKEAIVGQHPMPESMMPVKPQYPGPNIPPAVPEPVRPQYPGPNIPPEVPKVAPVEPPVPRTAPSTPSSQLEAHIAENDARLASEKAAAYEKYRQAPAPKGIDLQDFKDNLTTQIARAGTDDEANALRKVLNNVNRIEAESDTQFESLDKLRRQLGKKAKFGDDVTGFEAIDAKLSRDLNRQLGERMKAEHPAYAEYTKKYSDLSQESKPAGSAFLKQAGAEEGSANLVKNALASPKNVNQTIAAIGPGGAAKLDELAVKHVQNTLGRLKGQALEDAVTDLGPSLGRLPKARDEALRLIHRDNMATAMEGIQKRALEAHGRGAEGAAREFSAGVKDAENIAKAANEARTAAQQRGAEGAAREFSAGVKEARTDAAMRNKATQTAASAAEKAQQTANSYTPMLNNLQRDIKSAQRASVLNSMVEKMWNDGLITDAEHKAFGQQIQTAANAADKQKKLETVSKYVAYALTGNYMISFGGPHFLSYISSK